MTFIMMDFSVMIEDAVEQFRRISCLSQKVIRIIGNTDTDGVSAASILIQTFRRMDLRFAVSMVKQLDHATLSTFARESYDVFFFLDLGSGCITKIHQILPDKCVLILDHHPPESSDSFDNIVHVNPYLCNVDGTRDISAAGVTYFFSVALSPRNRDLSYLALLGAVGDAQGHSGFSRFNASILQDALARTIVVVQEGVRIYGITTKPLYKVLEYSTNPYIPGVCGNEGGAIKFLDTLGIRYRDGLSYRRYADLDKEEAKRFISAVMMNKINPEESVPESIYGTIYFVHGEEEDSPTHELYEFSTLLNCCGKLGKASFGVGTCLGDVTLREKALTLLYQYRNNIIDALQWFYSSRGTEHVLELSGATVVNAGERVPDTIIGVLTSLISKSLVYPEGSVVIGMARTAGDDIKLSFRVSGFGEGLVDLRVLVQDVIDRVGGTGGGHRLAAGATIPQQKEKEFLQFIHESFFRPTIPTT